MIKKILLSFTQGETSLTDTTLNRQFSPSDPNDVITHHSLFILMSVKFRRRYFGPYELPILPSVNPQTPIVNFLTWIFVESTILGEGENQRLFCLRPGNALFKTRFNRDKNCLYLNAAEQGSLIQRSLPKTFFS